MRHSAGGKLWPHRKDGGPIRVLICGGRDYDDAENVALVINLLKNVYRDLIIIEGGARGADTLAREEAKRRGIHCATVPALWDTYKKGAGDKRNRAMVFGLEPHVVVAFPGGRGTENCVRHAKEQKIDTVLIGWNEGHHQNVLDL